MTAPESSDEAEVYAGTLDDDADAQARRAETMLIWNSFLDRFLGQARFGYDLGCGTGALACELARRGVETIGIDSSAGQLAVARAVAASRALTHVSFQQHRLPVVNLQGWRQADIVTAAGVLEHMPTLTGGLRFAQLLLRPGGLTVFGVQNGESAAARSVRLSRRLFGRQAEQILAQSTTTQKSLATDLSLCGFASVEQAYFGKAGTLNRILGVALPERLTTNIIIVAARRL